MDEAWKVAEDIGPHHSPVLYHGRPGGGIAYNRQFEEICQRGLDLSPTNELLIEESLIGWKEDEMAVVRDKTTTASSSARLKTSTPWAYTPVTPLLWRRPRP